MDTIQDFANSIEHPEQRNRIEEIFQWIGKTFPEMDSKIGWKQPMFTHHGTFIIAFSVAKKHMAVAPEHVAIQRFSDDIIEAGYDHTKEIIRMPWNKPLDYGLLEDIIRFNLEDKKEITSFWRK